MGIYQAIANYYRYVAADLFPGHENRAVSIVLSAGVAAAVAGPVLATVAATIMTPKYAGSYLLVSALAACAFLTLLGLPRGVATVGIVDSQARGQLSDKGEGVGIMTMIRHLLLRPKFIMGASVCFSGCFAMALIMSGAPLVLEKDLHASDSFRAVAMQTHMIGMYFPMLFLPLMVDRFSQVSQIVVAFSVGIGGMAIGAINSPLAVLFSLLAIGVAWAVLYGVGSSLLTTSYSADERSVARGVGELFPVAGLALGSLLAAVIVSAGGWYPLIATAAAAMAGAWLVVGRLHKAE
ncbi:Major Facilitator Superfamily protein [Corynebacterium oculi]|uniref:Major Facilitator Superfamily protein n=1 Tax=Corynebacterium oculi TaxID=1544416 RepID=A0A0Q0YF88_9CORY|nr:Major Facilitator Superfamily protein [Corynebacterium oculi]